MSEGVGSAVLGQAAAAPVDGTGAGAGEGPWVPSHRGHEGSHGAVDEPRSELGPGRMVRPDGGQDPVDSAAPM